MKRIMVEEGQQKEEQQGAHRWLLVRPLLGGSSEVWDADKSQMQRPSVLSQSLDSALGS